MSATKKRVNKRNFQRLLNVCKTLIYDFSDLDYFIKDADGKPIERAAELIRAATEAVAQAEGDLLKGGKPW